MIDLEKELSQTFSLQKNSEKQFSVRLSLPKNLSYFAGHFPQFPVLPAVGLIDISVFMLKQHNSKLAANSLRKVELLKIKSPLGPDQQVKIQFIQNEDLSYTATWLLETTSADTEIAELSFII